MNIPIYLSNNFFTSFCDRDGEMSFKQLVALRRLAQSRSRLLVSEPDRREVGSRGLGGRDPGPADLDGEREAGPVRLVLIVQRSDHLQRGSTALSAGHQEKLVPAIPGILQNLQRFVFL